MKRRKGVLSAEDRELWNRIRRSATPLAGREAIEDWLERDEASPGKAGEAASLPKPNPRAPFLPPYVPRTSGPAARADLPRLDEHTARQIRKGRIEIDARIDLHGMTQTEAHRSLHSFLERAQAQSHRIVLVITGKGRGGDGVLRRAVPMWLAEPQFHDVAAGWRSAHLSHGGEGAIYVRVRRRRTPHGSP